MSTGFIYLDNSATTAIREEVLDAMYPYQSSAWGNASSPHELGQRSRRAIDKARAQVATMIGAESSEIFFTPSATYSNNVALLGRARYVEKISGGQHLITTSIEHSSVHGPVKHLEANGWRVTYLGVDSTGRIDVDELRRAITSETSIISIMWGNNEIGSIQPIREIAEIAKSNNIFFHTDAVQAAGKVAISVADSGIDTLSMSGHKFSGPKGIGVLFIRENVSVFPIFFGGGQEEGLFPGTENVANIVGIGAAAELANLELEKTVSKLRRLQESVIEKLCSLSGVELTGPSNLAERIPGHVSVTVADAHGPELVRSAGVRGLLISSVSACSTAGAHASHVLKAIGLSEQKALGSLRITAGIGSSPEDCDIACEIVRSILTGEAPNLISIQRGLRGRAVSSVSETVSQHSESLFSSKRSTRSRRF